MKMRLMSLAAGAAVVLALSACGGEGAEGADPVGSGTQPAGDAADAVDANQADIDFAHGMIVHHEQAVEMSDIVLVKADLDDDVAELAEAIKAAQGPEIEQMHQWLQAWGEIDSDDPHAGMDHGGMVDVDTDHAGMMSADDLAALEAASGPEASALFLEQMIVHHEGAVAMAEEHLATGQNPEVLELSQNVIDDQNAEIELMREMLAGD